MKKNQKPYHLDQEFNQQDDHDEDEDLKGSRSSDFQELLEASFQNSEKKLKVGEKIVCELVAISGDEVFFALEQGGPQLNGTASKRELMENVKENSEYAEESGEVVEFSHKYKVGDKIPLFITKIRGQQVFLAAKASSKLHAEDLLDAFRSSLPVEGKVVEACKGGARVSVRGKMAFCPLGQLDLVRVESVDKYIGEKFDFVITQLEDGGRNIVVSRRKLLQVAHSLSLETFKKEKREGDMVIGTVKKLSPIGAFVEIAPGLEGLLHISEMSWSRVNQPQEVVFVGQTVTVKILKIEMKEQHLRVSLSLKQATEEPWAALLQGGEVSGGGSSDGDQSARYTLQEGRVVPGKVTRCLKFGAFVQIAPGIEGLIPLSEMSYKKRVVRSDELIKEGDIITVMIKEINPEAKKILLSLKDAGTDPWILVAQKFPIGSVVSGRVERIEPYGIFVQLEEGITGLLHKSQASNSPEFPYDRIKRSDTVSVQIREINQEERRISLGVPNAAEQDEWRKHVGGGADGGGSSGSGERPGQMKATLADKFKKVGVKKG